MLLVLYSFKEQLLNSNIKNSHTLKKVLFHISYKRLFAIMYIVQRTHLLSLLQTHGNKTVEECWQKAYNTQYLSLNRRPSLYYWHVYNIVLFQSHGIAQYLTRLFMWERLPLCLNMMKYMSEHFIHSHTIWKFNQSQFQTWW